MNPLDGVIARLQEIDEHVARTGKLGVDARKDMPVSRIHYRLKPRTV
jgi:hypothetical protein